MTETRVSHRQAKRRRVRERWRGQLRQLSRRPELFVPPRAEFELVESDYGRWRYVRYWHATDPTLVTEIHIELRDYGHLFQVGFYRQYGDGWRTCMHALPRVMRKRTIEQVAAFMRYTIMVALAERDHKAFRARVLS